MGQKKSTIILLVEDDPADQKMFSKILISQPQVDEVSIAESVEEAMRYLQNCKIGGIENPRPNLILLDLNLPDANGKELLKILKRDNALCLIPVVILTTSDLEDDIDECYKLGAAGYIVKSSNFEVFQMMIEKFAKYWFSTSMLVKN